MSLFPRLWLVCIGLLLAACGTVGSAGIPDNAVQAGSLRIFNAWMRTPNGASNTDAVYMVIRNTGAEADQLVGATADVARTVELHRSSTDSGVVSMRQVKAIAIPAGGAVTLETGVYHLMLFDPTRTVKAGDKITLNLQFAKAGTVSFQVDVRDAPRTTEGGGSDQHTGHQH